MNNDLLNKLQNELDVYKDLKLDSSKLEHLIVKWKSRVEKEPSRFIKDDYRLDIESLQNFRRLFILLEDWPQYDLNKPLWKKYLRYFRTYTYRKWLIDCLLVLKGCGYDDLLKKYPCNPIGNPVTFRYEGYNYTYRWVKQIYYLGLMRRILGDKIKGNFIALDLGSGWGIFSSLLKQERPASHHILVDFPEMLLLAHYFLGKCFPEAKIAGVKEIRDQEALSRTFIEKYDFVLIPVTFYKNLKGETVDLYTNFASLLEMKREWFDHYLKSAPFLTSKYFYTVNRIISQPTYDTDITLLDYVRNKPKEVLHFATHPIPSGMDKRKYFFYYEKIIWPPLFEYICEM